MVRTYIVGGNEPIGGNYLRLTIAENWQVENIFDQKLGAFRGQRRPRQWLTEGRFWQTQINGAIHIAH